MVQMNLYQYAMHPSFIKVQMYFDWTILHVFSCVTVTCGFQWTLYHTDHTDMVFLLYVSSCVTVTSDL